MAKLRPFDAVKLQAMVEPFYVRVTRMKNGRSEPVPLPPKEGYAAIGQGWTKDEVQNLDTWMPTSWGGGGLYTYTVTDAQSATMAWDSSYSLSQYPERYPQLPETPPPPPQSGFPAAPVPQMAPQQLAPAPVPNWMIQAGMTQAPPPPFQPQAPVGMSWPGQPAQPPQWGQQPQWMGQVSPRDQSGPAWWGPPPPQVLTTPRDSETALREQLAQDKLARLEDKHTAARQAAEERHRNEMLALTQKMDLLASALQQKPQGEDAALREAREEARRARELAEQERRDREQERRERETAERFRAEMQAQQQKLDVLMTEMRNGQLASQQAHQTNAILSMVTQQTQQTAQLYSGMQASLEKVHERSSAQSLEMLRSASSGADNAFKHMTEITGGYKALMDMTMQMQGGGSGTTEKVIDAVNGAAERGFSVLEQYQQAKQAEAVAKEKTKQVEAQASVMHAQANAQTAAAQAYAAQQAGLNGAAPAGEVAAPVNGAAGAAAAANGAAAAPVNGAAAAPVNGAAAAPVNGAAPKLASVPASAGAMPSDLAMLGHNEKILEYVTRLRATVKKGGPLHGKPEKTADRILYAVNMIKGMKLDVPALQLFDDEKLDEFIEFLLPAVGATFREAVEEHMKSMLSGQPPESAEEESDDDAEGEDSEEAEDENGDHLDQNGDMT